MSVPSVLVDPPVPGDWIYTKGLPLAFAASAILWIGPYWAWTTPLYFRLMVVVVAVGFAVRLGTIPTRLASRNVLLTLLLLALLFYFGAHRYGGPFVISSGWLILLVFMLVDDRVKEVSLRYFSIAFALSLVPGLVVLLLSVLGIEVPWHALTPRRFDFDILLGNRPGFFRGYPGSVVLNDQVLTIGGREVFRLSGMYDEPGVVGTFSALLLVSAGVRLKGRADNLILLAGGLLSFSLAFYVIMFLYLLLRRPLLTMASGLALTGALLSTPLGQSRVVQLYFLSRFTFDGARFLGDNRVTSLFTALYQDFWKADVVTRLFGSPHDVAILVNTGTFSYKVVVYAYGVVGMVALVGFLVTSTTLHSHTRASIILLIVFLLSIYQRPNVLDLPYLLILLGGAVHLERREDIARARSAPIVLAGGTSG